MNDLTNLPLTMTHWGTYRVETKDGKVKALHGFERDPDPSPIARGMPSTLDDDLRIRAPMFRKSWLEHGPGANTDKRGAETFIELGWEEAERLIADELNRVRESFGNDAIFGGSYGWSSAGRFHHAVSQLHRFLNCIGGYTSSRDTYSHAAGAVVTPYVLGSFDDYLKFATSWPSIAENSDLLVAFGGLPLKNAQIDSGGVGVHAQRDGMRAARDAGVKFVNISPLKSDVLDYCDAEWLTARPGTDTAIILALCHTLLVEKRFDQAFVDRYTVGFDRFKPYLLGDDDGQVKDANWAAGISGMSASTIIELARRMSSGRTMISLSWSLTRQDHGEQVYFSAIVLAAMLGQIGLPGGGIGLGYSALNSIGSHRAIVPLASLPQGRNQIKAHIPVARISDLLLNPGKPFDYNGYQQNYPDIKVVYWAGGNPFHHHQDLNRMLKAWQRPDTIIVNEWCWNSLARHADIVLPCSTMLERSDIGASKRDPFMISMSKAVEPPEGVRNDYDIFSGVAARMGCGEEFTEGRTADEWVRWIYEQSRARCADEGIDLPSFEAFQRDGYHQIAPPEKPVVMLEAFRRDPDKHPLKTDSGLIEIFSERLQSFGYEDCPGHPVWLEPLERLGRGDSEQHPLHLISNQPPTKLHSQFDHGVYSKAAKIKGRESVSLHPDDAAARGLENGDIVRVFNARGACLGGVVVSDNLMPGAVQMSTGSWYDPEFPGQPGSLCKAGNPNVLTPDIGTSRLAQGPSAHTCLVQVEKFEGEPPPVTIYSAPEILSKDEFSTAKFSNQNNKDAHAASTAQNKNKENAMNDVTTYPVAKETGENAWIDEATYKAMYKRSLNSPDAFWKEMSEKFLVWYKKPTKAGNYDFNTVDIKWFEDGEINVCYNCVDRHADTSGDDIAIIWESDEGDQTLKITYNQLKDQVSRFANVMKARGVKKGDRVCIYMPMIPEAAMAALACARIGAVHSIVFGGFSPTAIRDRILDSDCTCVITADEGPRGGKPVPLKKNVQEALEKTPNVHTCIVTARTGAEVPWTEGRDIWLHEEMEKVSPDCPPEIMSAEDPLFILYTSGSTGKPKGVVHTSAGYLLWAAMTFRYTFDYKDGEVYWCGADVGWITGHSYIVYGPLANGATSLMFEGVPNYPDASRFWQIIDKYKVSLFYTAPTAIRALIGAGDRFLETTSRDSLRILGTVGEPINPEAWEWYYRKVGKGNCPIVDTWWQTETGGHLITPLPGATTLKPGSATKPYFGIVPVLLDKDGKELEGATDGALCIKHSWPGQMRTVWGDHERFKSTYFATFPGYYMTGDGARRDADGDFWITGRVDDVMNVSGHRLGTAEIESALVLHDIVAEAAVVGFPHDIKGEAIYAYVTLVTGNEPSEELRKELVALVRKEISPIATPDAIQFAPGLPKTRSGKIMRRILRKVAANDFDNLGDTSTLADPSVVKDIIDNRVSS